MESVVFVTLIVVASAANARSQLLLKRAAADLSPAFTRTQAIVLLGGSFVFWRAIWAFLISLSLYGYLLSHYDAVVVFPAMALTHVFVFGLSVWVLQERVPAIRYFGVSSISIGFLLMVLGDVVSSPRPDR